MKNEENEIVDLFEFYELLPQNIQDFLVEKGEVCGYYECAIFLDEMELLGYTFTWGLDGCPIELEKIKV